MKSAGKLRSAWLNEGLTIIVRYLKRYSKKQKDKLHRYQFLLFLLPSFLGVMVFVLIPFLDVIRRSFCTAVTSKFVGVQNYETVFQNTAFVLAVKNTALFTIVCLPVLIIFSFVVAVLLGQTKVVQSVKSILLLPMAVPAATLVLVWRILFDDNGNVNFVLDKLGITPVRFMETGAAFFVLVGSYVWKNLGYTVLLWLTGIMNVSNSILEAAKADGASDFQCLIYIIMPNLKPTLYTITVISFLNSFKVFREAYLVAGSYPHESMYLLQHLFNNWFTNLELDKMASSAVCIFTVIFFVILILQKLWDTQEGFS